MHLEMSKTQQSRTNFPSKRQGIVYNGEEQVSHFDGLPSSLVRGYNYSTGQNGDNNASNLVKYNKEDETRKSTGSIHNFGANPEYFHVRSSSDTSEIMLPASYATRKNNEKNGERPERPTSGDSFNAILQRFENASFQGQLGQRLTQLTTKKGSDRTDWGGSNKVFKSPLTSGTASPISDKKAYLNLKRKSSLKTSASRKSKSDEKGGIIDERNWEKPRKAFAHYDVQSAAFDFEIIANSIAKNGDCQRRKNMITGASAASGRETAAVIADKNEVTHSTSDEKDQEGGDFKTNDLVLSCPYFRNELGGEQDEIFGEFRYNSSYKTLNGQKTLNKRHSTLDVVLTAYDSIRRGQVFSATGVTILDSHLTHGEGNEPYDLSSVEDRKMFEHVDHGAFYYRHYFLGQDHVNYVGEDERFGAIAISYRREKTEIPLNGEDEATISQYEYRVIIRTSEMETLRGSVLEECIPSTSRHGTARGLPPKDILEYVCPEVSINSLKLATAGPKVSEILLKLDEQGVTRQHKIGILYCKAGQGTEEEMYNNEEAGPAFNEFMDLIGDRVVLKGFEGYRAQLDNRNDSTGVYSLYRTFRGREVMFHVSTMLPYTANNRQQLLRKRHIGNDIVTIVFQEPGALQFTPKSIRSHFQHVFILVRVYEPCTTNTRYHIAVSRSKDVPAFGPPIPAGGIFTNKEGFKTFLITKLINAENAAHKSDKFRAMAVRTRHEYLKDLVTNYATNTTVESGAKFGKFSLSSKKKEKNHPNINPELLSKGGLSWDVEVEDHRNTSMIKCFLVLSVESFVLIDVSTREAIFYIPCKAIIGWTPMSKKLKIFHGVGDCLVLSLPSPEDIPSIVRRLEIVTIGCQTISMTLRRHNSGQLGFNVHNEGMVVDVEPNGLAQVAGLKQSSRLVEIFGKPVAMMGYDEMISELRRPSHVPVVVIPPFPSGKPRKGVQLAAVNYNSPTESLSTFSTSRSQQSLEQSPHSSMHEPENSNYSNTSTLRLSAQDSSKEMDETKTNGVPWIRRPGSPANSEEKYSEHGSARSGTSQEQVQRNYGSSYTLTGKRSVNQPNDGATVLSLKYIPRTDPSAPKTVESPRRNDDNKTPESQTRTYIYTRTPKVADKKAAADLLQSKLSAHTRGDPTNPRHVHRAPPYPGPKPSRPPEYTPHDERRALNLYKPDAAKKPPPSGLEMMHPRLEIIHSRSKSEPWDPGYIQDGSRRTYKETTLGPNITTVETFRDNYDNAMSDTVNQIEKAFGGPSARSSDHSPSMHGTRKTRRPPAVPRLQDSESHLSSTSNESLPTSEPYSDSERERSSSGQKKPVSSKRLVSKKIGVRAEITSTTAKSPGAADTHNAREVASPSIKSSTTVFVRSKSNEAPAAINTGSLKRTPRVHSNTLPRTVNREEVTISRGDPGALTPRKRQGLIRELSQNDNAYVYSPRPFHTQGGNNRGVGEPEAFQFPDPDTRRIRDEKPKIVSQTKIALMSPNGSTTQLNSDNSSQGSARAPKTPEKDTRTNKVPYFVKNKRDHTGITPELVEERISKIAGKQRSKQSPDVGRSREGGEKDTQTLNRLRQTPADTAPLKQSDSQSSLSKENKSDTMMNEVTYLLSQTDAMSRDASSTLAHTEQMLASWEKVLSQKKDESDGSKKLTHSNTTSALRMRLPSDGTPISVSMRLGQATLNATPRRHSFDERILGLNDTSFESKENMTSSRQTLLSSKDGFHRIAELECKVTELSFFLQKEREENIELKRRLLKLEKGKTSRR